MKSSVKWFEIGPEVTGIAVGTHVVVYPLAWLRRVRHLPERRRTLCVVKAARNLVFTHRAAMPTRRGCRMKSI